MAVGSGDLKLLPETLFPDVVESNVEEMLAIRFPEIA